MRVISFFFKSSWKIIFLAAFGSAAAAASNLLALKFLGEIITEERRDIFTIFGYVSVLIILSSFLTLYLGKYVTRYFEKKVADYRIDLAKKSLLSKYEKIESKLGKLVPILLFETNVIGGFGKNIPELLVAVFQAIVVLAYLFKLSWVLTFAFIPIFLIISFTNIVTLSWFKRLEKSISTTRFALHFSLDRLEKGFKDLLVNKTHSNAYISKAIDNPNQKLVELNVRNFYLRALLDKSQNAFVIICLGLLLVYAMTNNSFGKSQLLEYMALILYIRPSLNRIANFAKQVKSVENALDQAESLDLDIKETLFKSEESVELDESKKTTLIEVDNVTYEYQGKSGFKLDSIDFKINRNEIVIINGSNGSGKSTLFKLIIGLYTPQAGAIRFQDNEINESNIQAYRSYFSCHFTDSPLFDDLRYVVKEDDRKRVDTLIDRLGLESKTTLDEGSTISDSKLSHGQKGRLNLFRLLLENREIYFLDEWAANQDIYFKEKFYNEIVPGLKKRGKTIILISHDDKFYSIADRLITLKNGKIENIKTSNALA